MRALAATLLVLAACDAYDEDLGPTPFFCGPGEQECPQGYTCVDDPAHGMMVCKSDSSTSNFECADDSSQEPDNGLTDAATASVGATLDGRAICPAGDKDTYAVMLSATANLSATIIYQAAGSELTAAILNTGGVPIQRASEVSGEARTLRAVATDLPSGLYYVQVSGGAGAVNNYELSLAP